MGHREDGVLMRTTRTLVGLTTGLNVS